MGIAATILDWAVTTIEALTPAAHPEIRFAAITASTIRNLPKVPGAHRRFTAAFDDTYTLDPTSGHGAADPIYVSRVLVVAWQCRVQGRSPHETYGVVCDDVDQIVRALRDPSAYPSDSTGQLVLVNEQGENIIDIDPTESTAEVVLPLTIKYRRN